MNWREHFLFGFFLFLIIGSFILKYPYLYLFILSLISGFCALLPDLDHKISKSRQLFDKLVPLLLFIFLFFYSKDLYSSILLVVFFSGLYFIFFTFFKPKHRGITHTLVFLILSSIILYLINSHISIAFLIGYLSHLIGDKTIKFI